MRKLIALLPWRAGRVSRRRRAGDARRRDDLMTYAYLTDVMTVQVVSLHKRLGVDVPEADYLSRARSGS